MCDRLRTRSDGGHENSNALERWCVCSFLVVVSEIRKNGSSSKNDTYEKSAKTGKSNKLKIFLFVQMVAKDMHEDRPLGTEPGSEALSHETMGPSLLASQKPSNGTSIMQEPLWPAHLHVKEASARYNATVPGAETAEAAHARSLAAGPPIAPDSRGHLVQKM
jgi:hypothetical protein